SKGRNGGWLTLNHILKREGQNPLPPEIGDTRLAPSTMKVLGQHGDPVNADDLKKVLDLLAAMKPVFPEDAKSLVKAIVPGIPPEALEAVIRRLQDYQPQTANPAPSGRSSRKKDDSGHEHGDDGKFTGDGGGSGSGNGEEGEDHHAEKHEALAKDSLREVYRKAGVELEDKDIDTAKLKAKILKKIRSGDATNHS